MAPIPPPRADSRLPWLRGALRAALALTALGLLACEGEPPPSPPPPQAAASPEPEPARPSPEQSHARMRRALERSAEELLASDEPNFGGAIERELRTALGRAPEDAPELRFRLLRGLAHRQLAAGDVEGALESHREAERLAAAAGAALADESGRQLYEMGVAYLRLGEIDNCTLLHNADRCLLPIRGGGVHERREGSEGAVRAFERVLADPRASSDHRRARWLLNIAHMTLGSWPAAVAAEHRVDETVFVPRVEFPRFSDVAAALGLDTMSLSGGVVAEDFDGDGLLDLVVSEWHPRGPLRFFRNRGDGGFEERSEAANLAGITGGLNLVQADYDGDGDVDVLVLRGAWLGQWGVIPNSLLRNDGHGRFVDVAFAAGVAEPAHPTQTAAFADYDNDGDLDLFVGNESGKRHRAPSQLFRNEGDGRFVDVAASAGVENHRYTKGVAWGDYDGDGWIDLYVSNMGEPNRLYRNRGDGRFEDVATALGVDEPIGSFPVWFWDFDNDGALDLYASAYRMQVDEVVASYFGLTPRAPLDRLYRGDGAGGFTDVAERMGLRDVTVPMGANFGDLDNDGFLDFYLGTGIPEYDGLVPNRMFWNRGGTIFADVTTAGGFGHLQKGHAVTFADLDNDGDQDVFAEMGGAYPGDAFMNALFENPGFGGHWLKLRLVGVRSNRSGFGARIRVDLAGPGGSRSIHRHVGSGSSFGGNTLVQEIGLGQAERVAALEVHWPASGLTQRFEDLPVDRGFTITEGEDDLVPLALPRVRFRDAPAPAPHEHHHAGRGAD